MLEFGTSQSLRKLNRIGVSCQTWFHCVNDKINKFGLLYVLLFHLAFGVIFMNLSLCLYSRHIANKNRRNGKMPLHWTNSFILWLLLLFVLLLLRFSLNNTRCSRNGWIKWFKWIQFNAKRVHYLIHWPCAGQFCANFTWKFRFFPCRNEWGLNIYRSKYLTCFDSTWWIPRSGNTLFAVLCFLYFFLLILNVNFFLFFFFRIDNCNQRQRLQCLSRRADIEQYGMNN